MDQEYRDSVMQMADKSKKLLNDGYVLINDVTDDPIVDFFGKAESISDVIDKAYEAYGFLRKSAHNEKAQKRSKGFTESACAFGDSIPHAMSDTIPDPNYMQHLGNRDGVVAVPDKDVNGKPLGTPGKGYIRYGADDRLPLHIYRSAVSQPYTASAMRFLKDIAYGKGILFLYKTCEFNNGKVHEIKIPYECAGEWLIGKIAALREELDKENEAKEKRGESEGLVRPLSIPRSQNADIQEYRTKAEPEIKPSESIDYSVIGTKSWMLKQFQEDYAAWVDTMDLLERIKENSDLNEVYAQVVCDDQHLDMFTLLISLEQGRKGLWDPKITRIQALKHTAVRLEQMDDSCNINYIYYSDALLYTTRELYRPNNIVAYPLLKNSTMIPDLKNIIKEGQKLSVSERNLHYAIMGRYPCGFTTYYEQPAWWSIFISLCYQYVSTMIFDKAVARQNATMWGKLIYINNDYLQRYYNDAGATKKEEKQALRALLVESINRFLRERKNNGKTCTLDSFIAPGTNTVMKSIEIVDVPQPKSSASGVSKEDLEECANLIFWACGIHSSLVATFGKNPSSGGTQQRELYALKQVMMSSRQMRFCFILNNIFKFNKMDKHLAVEIGREVLSTLDRSKTGIVEMNTGNTDED